MTLAILRPILAAYRIWRIRRLTRPIVAEIARLAAALAIAKAQHGPVREIERRIRRLRNRQLKIEVRP